MRDMESIGGRMDWNLLKRVSRSFYLTLRLLPAPVRESIALGYLMARLSDTKADGADTEAEKELLDREAECHAWLERSPDKDAIEKVWKRIQEGQRFDGQRFASAGAPPLTPEERDRYTYLVAGCVGEFWTEICLKKLPNYSAADQKSLHEWGVKFGKGLQLVNILRDRKTDAGKGRIYLQEQEIPSVLNLALEHLEAAERYTESLNSRRMRAACALPLLMARATLNLVRQSPSAQSVKIPRRQVYWLMLRSLFY